MKTITPSNKDMQLLATYADGASRYLHHLMPLLTTGIAHKGYLQNWEAFLISLVPEATQTTESFEFASEVNDSDPLVIQIQEESKDLRGEDFCNYLVDFYSQQKAVERAAKYASSDNLVSLTKDDFRAISVAVITLVVIRPELLDFIKTIDPDEPLENWVAYLLVDFFKHLTKAGLVHFSFEDSLNLEDPLIQEFKSSVTSSSMQRLLDIKEFYFNHISESVS